MISSDKDNDFGITKRVKLPYTLIRSDTNHVISNQTQDSFDFSKINTPLNPAYQNYHKIRTIVWYLFYYC